MNLEMNQLSKYATDLLYEARYNSDDCPIKDFGDYTRGVLDLVAFIEHQMVTDDEEEKEQVKRFVEALDEALKNE